MTDAATPVHLPTALASFEDVYSPRIVARMNDYDVRIAHTRGEHVWHVHENTDEFFLVLDGTFDIALRDATGAESTVHLSTGDTFVVPRGTEHKPSSAGGSILMFEPSGTSTTGDRHDGDIPSHVDSTTGRELGTEGRPRVLGSSRAALFAIGIGIGIGIGMILPVPGCSFPPSAPLPARSR